MTRIKDECVLITGAGSGILINCAGICHTMDHFTGRK